VVEKDKKDKFVIFGKKFAKLDNEAQDKLVKTAHELFKAHRGIKSPPKQTSNAQGQ
jgi:hypothetical protein